MLFNNNYCIKYCNADKISCYNVDYIGLKFVFEYLQFFYVYRTVFIVHKCWLFSKTKEQYHYLNTDTQYIYKISTKFVLKLKSFDNFPSRKYIRVASYLSNCCYIIYEHLTKKLFTLLRSQGNYLFLFWISHLTYAKTKLRSIVTTTGIWLSLV